MKDSTNPFSSPLLSKDPPNVSKNRSNRPSRPPVYNPWDKFNQTQFDDFIDGITSALKKALDHELDAPETSVTTPARHVSPFNRVAAEPHLPTSPDPLMSSDGELEDSFAELKSARAKGKERDPREGPGLGGFHNPIELFSDDEEEGAEGNSRVSEEYGDSSRVEEEEDTFRGPESTGYEQNAGEHDADRPTDEDIIEISSSDEEEQPSSEAYDHLSYERSHPLDISDVSGTSSRNVSSPAKISRKTGWLAEEPNQLSPGYEDPACRENQESFDDSEWDDDAPMYSDSVGKLIPNTHKVLEDVHEAENHQEMADDENDDEEDAMSPNYVPSESQTFLSDDEKRFALLISTPQKSEMHGHQTTDVEAEVAEAIPGSSPVLLSNTSMSAPAQREGQESEGIMPFESLLSPSLEGQDVDILNEQPDGSIGKVTNGIGQALQEPKWPPSDDSEEEDFSGVEKDTADVTIVQRAYFEALLSLPGNDLGHATGAHLVGKEIAKGESIPVEETVLDNVKLSGPGIDSDFRGTPSVPTVAVSPTSAIPEVDPKPQNLDAPGRDAEMEEIGTRPVIDADKLPDTHDGASCDHDPQITAGSDRTHSKNNTDVTPDRPFSKEMPYRFPPPVSADPSVPDPTDFIHSSSPSRTPTHVRPTLGSLPTTPRLILSPHPTPGRPTPVSVPVSAAILKAMQMHQSHSSSSGLFTPQNEAEDTPPEGSDDKERVSNGIEETLTDQEEMPAEKGEETADEQPMIVKAMVVADADAISSQGQAVSDDQEAVEQVLRQTPDSVGNTANSDSGTVHRAVSCLPSATQDEAGSSFSEELELMYPFDSEPQDVVHGISDNTRAKDFSQPPMTFDLPDSKVAPLSDREPTPIAQDGLKSFGPETSPPKAPPMADRLAPTEKSVEPQDDGRAQSADAKFPVVSSSNPNAQLEEDPFKLMGNESTIAPGAVNGDEDRSDGSNDTAGIEHTRTQNSLSGEILKMTSGSEFSASKELIIDSMSSPTSEMQVEAALRSTQSSETPNVRSLKRKQHKDEWDNSSTSGGSSAVLNLLHFTNGSQDSPSILASGSEASEHTSPTSSIVPNDYQNSPSDLLHLDAPLRHLHGPTRQLPQPSHQPRLQPLRLPSPSEKETSPHLSFSFSPARPTVSNPPSATIRPKTSPLVTRSNCRFHKISLPREESGPRVYFLVPGCSLGDHALMEKEGIMDHGDATIKDSKYMVADIESLDFSSSLVGVLRQLVGVDLLREQEVFYLQRPGDPQIRKSRRISSVKSLLGLVESEDASSPHKSALSRTRPRSSTAKSLSKSPSAPKQEPLHDSDEESSLSSDEESSQDDCAPPSVAEVITSPPAESENSKGDSGNVKPTPSGYALRSGRRSKRLSRDAAAYQPGNDSHEESSNEGDEDTRSRRNRRSRRRVKRTHVGENEDDQTASQSRKKPRRSIKNDI